MARVIFLNRFFHPDHSATSQMLTALASHLAEGGSDVHVIASRQRYDDPQAKLPERETVGGVQVHRVATTGFGRSGLVGRSIDYGSYYAATRRALLALAASGDIIVAKTDPPMLSVLAMQAAKRRRARLVNWLQDLYPEVAGELGLSIARGPAGRFLAALRDSSLKAAAANVVVGERMAEKVLARGVRADRVHVIHNWSDDRHIRPVPHSGNPLRHAWSLADKFVVGYAGNLGRAHEFRTILDASERLKGNSRIVFLMIGGGREFEELAREATSRTDTAAFRFIPYQAQSQLNFALGAADVHWVSLRPQLEGLVVPSKFYGIAAAGRPVIAIASDDGEIARLVRRHGCGVIVAPGDANALAAAIVRLSENPDELAALGTRARAMLDAHFSQQQAFARWREILQSIG